MARSKSRPKKDTIEFDISKILGRFDNYDKAAIGLAIFAIIIRVFLSPHCFWIDESREMAVARNFMRGDGYTLYGQYYVQHPYVFYTLIGISSLIFGMQDAAGMAVSIVAGTLSIIAIYLLGREVYNEKVGIISAILFNFHPLHLFYSTRVINDVTMILFTILAIYFFVRFNRRGEWRSLYISSAFVALAMLTKMVAIVLLPVLLVCLLVKKRLTWLRQKEYWFALAPFAALLCVYMAINFSALGEPFPLTYYLERFAPGGVDVGPWTFYIANFIEISSLPVTVLFVWGLLCTFLMGFRNSRLLLLWTAAFFIVISLQADKVDRYMLPILPEIIIIGAVGVDKVLRDFKSSPMYGAVAIVLLLLSYNMYSYAALLVSSAAPGFCGFRETGQWLQQVTSADAPLMVGSDNQIAWYADRENIHHFPSSVGEFYEYTASNMVTLIIVDRWERTQPEYVFSYSDEGVSFWYPHFLNDSRFPFVNVIMLDDQPISFIYFVNYTA